MTRPQPSAESVATRFPLGWSTIAALLLASALGASASAVCGLELVGMVPLGRFTRSSSEAELALAVVVGALLCAFGLTALLRARLACSERALELPRFLPWGSTETIPLDQIARHGSATHVVRGARQTYLVVELRDGTSRSARVSLFRGGARVVDVLTAVRGSPASPVVWHLGEPRFERESS